MAGATTLPKADIEARLAGLRDNPVNTTDTGENILMPIYNYLMAIPADPDGFVHWFCAKADSVTISAATFLIRLFAYNSDSVIAWKKKFEICLAGCAGCVQGFGEAKVTSRHTYFDIFPDHTMQLFYATVNGWELQTVIETLSRAGINLDHTETVRKTALTDASPAVIYHIVSNLFILQDSRILPLLRYYPLPEQLPGWPIDPPPPGLILLMIDEDANVRRWAQSWALKCTLVPIPRNTFIGPFVIAVEVAANALSAVHNTSSHSDITPPLNLSGCVAIKSHSFPSDRAQLWVGFCAILRLIPVELLTSNADTNVDLRRVIMGHLHDIGPEFSSILKCFILLLKRMGSSLWQGERPEYPQLIFDAIKDNPSYLDLLHRTEPTTERPWIFAWFWDYLFTIRGLASYGDVLAKMVGFMCGELQHERFQDARPAVMIAAARLLSTAIRKSHAEEMAHQREATSRVFGIHMDILIAVAFARSYNDVHWRNARIKVRELISSALLDDVYEISCTIKRISKGLASSVAVNVPIPGIQKQMWTMAYNTLQAADVDGLRTMISVVARAAHLDRLNEKSFNPASHPLKTSKVMEKVCEEVNQSLSVIRNGFLDAMSRYADDKDSSVLDLLRGPGVVKDIMVLMLSPVEGLQVAAQNLVGQAFDVDVRLDCFRALLENLPDASLEGIFHFLDAFINHATIVPEACSLSKSLVRCLTDVIEVLCASHDGLLRNHHFLKPAGRVGPVAEIPKFWSLMTRSIAVIFKLTPLWSRYYDPDDMIIWMRDALIFGRDMLAQRRVIEAAAIVDTEQSISLPKKLSRIGRKMVDDLQEVLPELARWLRLTDQELLHQSFSLLQSLLDCFRESCITPAPIGINKLNKHIDDARKGGPSRPQTRLDSSRLSKLEDSLAAFDGSDDDVEIISHTVAPQHAQLVERDAAKLKTKSTSVPEKLSTGKDVKQTAPKGQVPQFPSSGQSRPQFSVDRLRQGLGAERSLLKFHKLPPAGISKPIPKRNDIGPKNEGVARITPIQESSSDSESDEEEHQGGLAALAKFQRSPKIKRPAERRQVKVLEPAKGRYSMEDRLLRRDDARRTALRLKPNISDLHRVLLSWNYDHQGSEPPETGTKPLLTRVPDHFTDHDQYRQIFEPLLMLECWSQIVQSKDQPTDSYQSKITSRQFTDDFLDFEITISDAVKRDWYLAETDIVLCRHINRKNCILAKVRSYTPRPWGIQAGLRCFLGVDSVDPGLQLESTWRLSKVFSLSTVHREYAALMALPHYHFFETILRPRLHKVADINRKEVKDIKDTYHVNLPQAIAISNALQTQGFALIQGPPGTGKTSTICGLVDVYLSKRPQQATAFHVGRAATSVDKGASKKILLCAPSNAAIDEVAQRINDGFRGSTKREGSWKVVRVGADRSINISVKAISLDSLIDKRMNLDKSVSSGDSSGAIAALREEIESVKRLRQGKIAEISRIHDNAARTRVLEDEIKSLNSRRMGLTLTLDKLKDKQQSDLRSLDAARRKFRVEILSEADIICCTLSGAGHELLEQFDFEMVVIDEAAQSIELSSLIPLRYNCRTCIMVGDPQQLPPTVISQEACRYQYNQSLFVRLQRHRPDAVHLLSVQYRMHPDIRQLPSRIFYDDLLRDGPDMAEKTKQPWHSHTKFGTYRFFNVSRGQEDQTPGHSLKNPAEAQVAVSLFARLRQEFSIDFSFKVGVVSMYSGQITELRYAFQRRFGVDILEKVDFHTVDGFQGQEKDVIILSCVRAGPGLQTVGFLADTRRINVALTRAKSSLFILGNAATLERSNEIWRNIILDSRSRAVFQDTTTAYFESTTTPVPQVIPRSKPKASIQPIPDNLHTPHDLTVAVGQCLPGMSSHLTLHQPNGIQSCSNENNHKSKVEAYKGHKRSINSDDDPQRLLPTSLPTAEMSRVKHPHPPTKRFKQTPTLFIPKSRKSSMYSTSDGGNSAGPSSHRK